MNHFTLCVVIIATVSACTSVTKNSNGHPSAENKPVVVAYASSWNTCMPDPMLMTHLNYAFGHVTESFNGVRIDNPERLKAMVALKARNASLKVLLSIGGWGSGRFSEMAANDSCRTSFAKDCRRVVDEFQLDGIDIDWEYPTCNWADISASADDTEHFTLLMRDIRNAIGREKCLTFADYCDTTYVDYREVMKYADFCNLMTYDMANPPKHHSALHRSEITGGLSVEEAVGHHLEAGVKSEQLVMGMPFYGRASKTYVGERAFGRMQTGNRYTECWDSVAMVPYLVDKQGDTVLCYENPTSIQIKCKFIMEKGLHGGMYWESGEDDSNHTLARTVWNTIKQ